MKLAIMQPYFFPYIGYFQLINAVDTFVVYDDVNFIKQGWINRNYILLNNRKQLITLELKGASSFKPINKVEVGGNMEKLVKTISQSYCRAPFFEEVFPVMKDALCYQESNLAQFIFKSLKNIADYLKIQTKFLMSSHIEKDNSLKGQDRVLDMCKLLNAKVYINAIGGIELYSKDEFRRNGIDLFFMRTKDIVYKQFDKECIPKLCIIDVLMFNGKEEVKRLLHEYELIL